MEDAHKMIAGSELRGTPEETEVLLVEAIRLTVDEYRHRPEIHPALITQKECFPCKTEGGFIPNAIGGMYRAFVRVHSGRILQSSPELIINNTGVRIIISSSRCE